jgi:hypothetical protein
MYQIRKVAISRLLAVRRLRCRAALKRCSAASGRADGAHLTVVNGEVLIEDGKHPHAKPGRVLRNARYQAQRPAV